MLQLLAIKHMKQEKGEALVQENLRTLIGYPHGMLCMAPSTFSSRPASHDWAKSSEMPRGFAGARPSTTKEMKNSPASKPLIPLSDRDARQVLQAEL